MAAIKVLMVDDETDLLLMVKRWLELWGLDVDTFDDPSKALEHLRKNPSSLYSLIITDIRMPGMTGLQLARHILAQNPDVKIILMTAYEIQPYDLQSIVKDSVKWEEVLKKPFGAAELCNAVKKHMSMPAG